MKLFLLVPTESNAEERYGYEYDRNSWKESTTQIAVDNIKYIWDRYDNRFGIDVYTEELVPNHVLMTKEDFCKEAGIEIRDLTKKHE